MLKSLRSLYIWFAIAFITSVMYVIGAPIFILTMAFDPLRKIGHWYATRWGRMMFHLNARWSCAVIGQEKIPPGRPLVVVANHQGIGDIMALYHLPLHYKWISKAANFYVPCMGWFMFHAGYIPLHRGRRDSIRRCMDRARWYLDRGVSILFFAEGTRSRDGAVLPFKPGAFKVAIDGKFDILPVGIGGTMNAIPKHSWKFSEERTPMKIVVGDVLSTAGLTDDDMAELMIRTRQVVVGLKAEADRLIAAELSTGGMATVVAGQAISADAGEKFQ